MERNYGTLSYVTAKRGGWELRADPHVAMRIKRFLPRATSGRPGYVFVSATQDVARDLEWLLERWPLTMSVADKRRLKRDARVGKRKEQDRLEVLAGRRLDSSEFLIPAVKARHYQLEAVDFAEVQRRFILGDAIGAGKTISSLLLMRNPKARPALAVVQTHLPDQWERERNKIWPDVDTHVVTSRQPYDIAERCGGKWPELIIMSYSKLEGWADQLAGRVKTVLFDEVQDLRKGRESNKGFAAGVIADAAEYVIGLSASSVYNHGNEIWSLYSIIAPDALGTWPEFAREFEVMDTKRVADPKGLGLYLRDQGLMLARTRKDIGRELGSDPIAVPWDIEFDEEAFAREAGDVLALAQRVLDKNASPKERFKVSGDLDWRMRQATGVAKAPHVAQLCKFILESTDKLVLFGWHRPFYDIILSELASYNPVMYTGSETPNEKLASLKAFMEGDARVLIMSLRSGAGIDGLQEVANTIVMGELDWSPEVHNQAIGRLQRDGMDEPVLVYWPLANQGSDPVVADVLDVKRQQTRGINDPHAPAVVTKVDNTARIKQMAQGIIDAAARAEILEKAS